MKYSPKHIIFFAVAFIIIFIIVSFVRNSMMSTYSYGGQHPQSSGDVPSVFPLEFRDTMGLGEIASPTSVALSTNGFYSPNKNSGMPYPVPGADAPVDGVSKIIKNAELAIVVNNIESTASLIESIRIKHKGEMGNSSFGNNSSRRIGEMTIWVPSDKLEIVLQEIKGGALRVSNEQIIVSDVSAQFVDTEARLKNLRATEAQYLEIMKRSGSIPDVLSVTRELSQTRQSIEQLQGQLNYLSRQIALSSIHISLTEETTAALAKDEWRPLSILKGAIRETLQDGTNFINMIIVFLIKLPVLILQLAFWVGIIYGLWRIGMYGVSRVRRAHLSAGGGEL